FRNTDVHWIDIPSGKLRTVEVQLDRSVDDFWGTTSTVGSPDDRELAFFLYYDRGDHVMIDIVVAAADGTAVRRFPYRSSKDGLIYFGKFALTPSSSYPGQRLEWSSDGRFLFFPEYLPKNRLARLDVRSGEKSTVFEVDGGLRDFDLSDDGGSLLTSIETQVSDAVILRPIESAAGRSENDF
ncbi:MAG TPA: hypothetical protein VMO47_04430, partial [Rhodothermales bacterium]|nr:hypothetical protein [Rhodothermales bacterium]